MIDAALEVALEELRAYVESCTSSSSFSTCPAFHSPRLRVQLEDLLGEAAFRVYRPVDRAADQALLAGASFGDIVQARDDLIVLDRRREFSDDGRGAGDREPFGWRRRELVGRRRGVFTGGFRRAHGARGERRFGAVPGATIVCSAAPWRLISPGERLAQLAALYSCPVVVVSPLQALVIALTPPCAFAGSLPWPLT